MIPSVITLIGMAGAGKNTLGMSLAKYLQYQVIDIDRLILDATGKTQTQLIHDMGENGFLKIEEQTILQLPPPSNTIIITGGSAVYSQPAMQYLKGFTTLLYLYATKASIQKRINIESRGIVGLQNASFDQIYEEREILYNKYADFTLSTENLSYKEMLEKAISLFE